MAGNYPQRIDKGRLKLDDGTYEKISKAIQNTNIGKGLNKFAYDEKTETFKPVRYNADNTTFMHSSKANGARKQVKPKITKKIGADVTAAQNFFNSVNKYRQGV